MLLLLVHLYLIYTVSGGVGPGAILGSGVKECRFGYIIAPGLASSEPLLILKGVINSISGSSPSCFSDSSLIAWLASSTPAEV